MERNTSSHPTLPAQAAMVEVSKPPADFIQHLKERGEVNFDALTQLAQNMFKVPLVLITLLDDTCCWIQASTIPTAARISKHNTLCEVAMTRRRLVIPNLSTHPTLHQHPITRGPFHLQFYAGVVLRDAQGEPLGALSLGDHKARIFHKTDLEQLQHLAQLVSRELQTGCEKLLLRRQVQNESHYDTLTSLPRQALAYNRLKDTLNLSLRHGQEVTVLRLDLDKFTTVNEVLGRDVGDTMLREVARRLRGMLPVGAMLARWQGDEFLVTTDTIPDTESALALARRLVDSISQTPFMYEGKMHYLTATAGLSRAPENGVDADCLLDRAAIAQRQARQTGSREYMIYDQDREHNLRDQIFLWNELHSALEKGEFWMAYQPKVDFKTGQICSAEALIRWNHPIHGFISPGRFIPVAEETGLIGALGLWTLEHTCQQQVAWRKQGLPLVPVAVNIAGAQLQEPGFTQALLSLLEAYDLEHHLIELELTERTLIEDTRRAAAVIDELNQHGITCSIDDFGTGYSSLSYLAGLPLHALKVDRSFVSKLSSGDKRAKGIVEAIISMSHSLGLEVIAEGVETQEELDFLRQANCDSFQGYFFCRPIPPDEFAQHLRDGTCLET